MDQRFKRRHGDPRRPAVAGSSRAVLAIDVFCYQVKKYIGVAASLGGVDVLVFTGGIGEHSPSIRAQICQVLTFGIALDPAKNEDVE